MVEKHSGGGGVGKVVMIVVLIPLAALSVQFGLLLYGAHTVEAAARAGLEAALRADSSRDAVIASVREHIGSRRWADKTHTSVLVNGVLDVGQTQGSELAAAERGDRVTVEVSVRAAHVVPDLLAPTGISVQSLKLSAPASGTRP